MSRTGHIRTRYEKGGAQPNITIQRTVAVIKQRPIRAQTSPRCRKSSALITGLLGAGVIQFFLLIERFDMRLKGDGECLVVQIRNSNYVGLTLPIIGFDNIADQSVANDVTFGQFGNGNAFDFGQALQAIDQATARSRRQIDLGGIPGNDNF